MSIVVKVKAYKRIIDVNGKHHFNIEIFWMPQENIWSLKIGRFARWRGSPPFTTLITSAVKNLILNCTDRINRHP